MHTEVDVPNPKFLLVPGMYASAKIPLHSVADVLMLPVQAIQAAESGKGVVLVVNNDNQIERREVQVGLQTGAHAEIVAGLKENEKVIFGEQNSFKVGERVSPKLVEAPGMEQ
jgi:multidrug efflux pump subunit AcrA (membrane-fusion protein)